MNEDLQVYMYVKYLPPRYSGAGQQALSLAGALRKRGVASIFLTEATPEQPSDYALDGFDVHTFHPATSSVSIQPLRCFNLARSFGGSRSGKVFHAHSAYPEASALGATARTLGIPSVLKVTLHGSDAHMPKSRIVGRLHRQLLRRQSAIIAISKEIEAELGAVGVHPAKIQRIPNGVDTDRFRPASAEARAQARRRFGIPEGAPVALFAGILNERKNVGWLLDMWEVRRKRGRGGLLLLVGPGNGQEDPLQRRVQALDADDESNVRWVGKIDRMEEAYAAADLFVLPSRSEGMPNVVLEAMAAGLAVVVTEGSGTEELLGAAGAGVAVDPGDDTSLLKALDMSSTPGRMEALGQAGRRRAEDHFSLDSVAKRYEALYRRLLGRDGSRANN